MWQYANVSMCQLLFSIQHLVFSMITVRVIDTYWHITTTKRWNITIKFSPFTTFTFSSNQLVHRHLRVKAHPPVFMHRAKLSYERCIRVVWIMPSEGKHAAYDCRCAVPFPFYYVSLCMSDDYTASHHKTRSHHRARSHLPRQRSQLSHWHIGILSHYYNTSPQQQAILIKGGSLPGRNGCKRFKKPEM